MAGFYRIQNGLMPKLRELSRAGLLVFHVLAEAANRMGQCWWSVERIAREIGLGVRQTARGVAEVIQIGLAKRLVSGGVGVATVYEVGNMPRPQVEEDARGVDQLPLFRDQTTAAMKRCPSDIPCQSPSAILCHTNQTQRNKTNTPSAAVAIAPIVAQAAEPPATPAAAAVFGLLRAKGVDGKRAYDLSGRFTLDDVQRAVALLEGRRTPFTPGKLIACVVGRWADEIANQPSQGEFDGANQRSGTTSRDYRSPADIRRAARRARECPETFTL